jgi:Flp pilus assembly protein TadG
VVGVKQFLSDQRGSATVEFVIWVPWFMLLLMITTDVSFIYLSQTQMLNVSRDAARRMSTGEIEPAEVATFAKAQLGSAKYTVTDCSTGASACVRITRPFADTAVFGGFLGDLIAENLMAETTMRKEPGV